MKMTKIFAAAATLAVAAPAFAADAPEASSFEHEGRQYVYTVTQQGDTRVIRGVEETSGKRFNLRVSGDRVRGQFGSANVSFRTSEASPLLQSTVVASR